MQTRLIIRTLEVCPLQPINSTIIPPQKPTHRPLEQVRAHHKSPELRPENILRRELHQRRDVIPLLVESAAPHDVDRYQDSASEDTKHEEDVPQHPEKPQEDDGIKSDLFYQLLLLHVSNGCDPAERLAIQLSRCMFFVSVFGTRSVDAGVAGSEDAEDEKEAAGDGEGVDDGGVDGIFLNLESCLANLEGTDGETYGYLSLERIRDQIEELVSTVGAPRGLPLRNAHTRIDSVQKASE